MWLKSAKSPGAHGRATSSCFCPLHFHRRRASKPQMRLKHTPQGVEPNPLDIAPHKPHLDPTVPKLHGTCSSRDGRRKFLGFPPKIHRISLWQWNLNTCITSSRLLDPEEAVQMGTLW